MKLTARRVKKKKKIGWEFFHNNSTIRLQNCKFLKEKKKSYKSREVESEGYGVLAAEDFQTVSFI